MLQKRSQFLKSNLELPVKFFLADTKAEKVICCFFISDAVFGQPVLETVFLPVVYAVE